MSHLRSRQIVHRLISILFIVSILTPAIGVMNFGPAAGQAPQAPQGIIYVDADATGANNGTSWANAFTTLQPAMDAAVSGDQVWVAAGTYYPSVAYCDFGHTGDSRYKTFQLKNGVAVYGGFDPSLDDRNWADRDWSANKTILSGDLGIKGDDSDNSYHVFCHPQQMEWLDNSAILDGFTIRDGNAFDTGGGMSNIAPNSPSLVNIIFTNNKGGQAGGGLYLNWYTSTFRLTNVLFTNNSAENGGGMMSVSSVTMIDVTFDHNTASGSGGGMGLGDTSTLTNVTFTNNTAGSFGGGLSNSSNSTLVNVTFSGNTAVYGGGMSNSGSSSLSNVTFSNNTATYGGGLYNSHLSPNVTNSIFWGDIPNEIAYDVIYPVVTYSDIQGGYSGEGNIATPPMLGPLADNGGKVWTRAFLAGTKAVDGGNPNPATCPATDARGEPRPVDGDGDGIARCDMGAYEAQSVPPAIKLAFMPVVRKSPSGITGRVTSYGQPLSGIPLHLRFWDGASWSEAATTTTDANGVYWYKNVPALSPGQVYYVRYVNENENSNLLSGWWTRQITQYAASDYVLAGDFDLANIMQASPASGSALSLPVTFVWYRRSVTPTDSYELNLFNPEDANQYYFTGPLGYVDRFTLSQLPPRIYYGMWYGWYISVYSPDGGYGESYWFYWIGFPGSPGKPVLPIEMSNLAQRLPGHGVERPDGR